MDWTNSNTIKTHRLVMVDEYMRHGIAKIQLNTQISKRKIRAFFLEVRCCNGRVIAMYLNLKMNEYKS